MVTAYRRPRSRDGRRYALRVDEVTSRRLGQIAQKDTRPERIVRKLLHGMGIRFRVNCRDLPGAPDIANRKRRWAIFVHGCFWHRHPGCRAATTPKRNKEFWLEKFRRNVERDLLATRALEEAGYRVVVVWECETRGDLSALAQRLEHALETQSGSGSTCSISSPASS